MYGDPANEAPAAVSMETDSKPEEEKKAPARGPVKGEKCGEEKEKDVLGREFLLGQCPLWKKETPSQLKKIY